MLFARIQVRSVLILENMWIPEEQEAYLHALEPRLSPAQPGRDRWGEQHKAPCPADSAPSFPNSLTPLFFFFFFPFPLSLLWKNGEPHSSTPPPFVALSSPPLSPTQLLFSSPQPRFAAFLSPSSLPVSLLSLCFHVLRVTSGMTDPWARERVWQTAEMLHRVRGVFVFALPFYSSLVIFKTTLRSPPPLSFCLSLSLSLFPCLSLCFCLSLTELWIFVRKYLSIYIYIFSSLPNLKNKRKEGGWSWEEHVSPMWKHVEPKQM